MLGPKLPWAAVAERLVRALRVVLGDPPGGLAPGLGEAAKSPDPDALLLQAAEESLDQAVLHGRVGPDEFLAEAVVPAGGPKSPTLEDEAVVAAGDRSLPFGSQRPESLDAGALERHLGLLSPPPQREFPAHDLAVVAVDHVRELPPAVASAVHVGHVERPAAVALGRPAALALDTRSRRHSPLRHEPALAHQDSVDGLAVHGDPVSVSEQGPQPAVAVGRVLPDQALEPGGQQLVHGRPAAFPILRPLACHRARHREYLADPTLGDARVRLLSHSPDVVGSEGRRRSAVRRMAMSSTSSPTFCLSRLICSSFRGSSSRGRNLSAFSAPKTKRSRQSATSGTFRPCLRAGSPPL